MFFFTRLLFATLAFSLISSHAFVLAEENQKTISELIIDLGSDDYAIRQNASATLIQIGEPCLKKVTQATSSPDPEVVHRAKSIAKEILKHMCWIKKDIKLHATGKKLSQFIAELSYHQGVELHFGGVRKSDPIPEDVILEKDYYGSFWEILEQIEAEFSLSTQSIGRNGHVALYLVPTEKRNPRKIIDGIKFEVDGDIRYDFVLDRHVIEIHSCGDLHRALFSGSGDIVKAFAITDSMEKLDSVINTPDHPPSYASQSHIYLHSACMFLERPQIKCKKIIYLEFEVELYCLGLPEEIILDPRLKRQIGTSDSYEIRLDRLRHGDHGGEYLHFEYLSGGETPLFTPKAFLFKDHSQWKSSVTNTLENGGPDMLALARSSFTPPIMKQPQSIRILNYRQYSKKRFHIRMDNIEISFEKE